MANLAQIKSWPHGAPIPELIATVARAWGPRHGESAHGPWSLLDLELKDSTGTMRAKWWNPPEEDPQAVLLKRVRIAAEADDKGQARGASVIRDEFRGKERVQIKVQGQRLALHTAGPAPAAPAPAQNGATAGAAESVSGLLKLIRHLTAELGGLGYEGQALSAIVNTILIAVTQGRVAMDPPAPEAEAGAEEAGESVTVETEDDFPPWP